MHKANTPGQPQVNIVVVFILRDDPELNYANLKALQKQLDEMYNYIRNNQMMIPNYGEMRRYGEPVSTAL